MKSKLTLFLIAISLCVFSCAKSTTDVKGSVYLVTQNGQEYKFNSVKISVIPEKEIKSFIANKNLDEESAVVSYRSIKLECDKLIENYRNTPSDELSAQMDNCTDRLDDALDDVRDIYFQGLPATEITATTGADGKFSVTLPQKGKYAIAARGERIVDDTIEKYHWMVWVDSDGEAKNIVLSNVNLLGGESPDSVVQQIPL